MKKSVPKILKFPSNKTYALIEELKEVKQRIKALEKEEELLKTQLMDGYFKDNKEFIFHERLIAFVSDVNKKNIDRTSFEKENPKLILTYNTTIEKYTTLETIKRLNLK